MSKSVCSTCKKCLFDANHDLCVVNYLSDVNACAGAKFVKSIKNKEWKSSSKMFKNVGYKWVPIGRNFTIVGNRFRLTRFTSTKLVPPRKPVKSTAIKNIKSSSHTNRTLASLLNIKMDSEYFHLELDFKEKKSVCFSAFYLQKKRNLLVLSRPQMVIWSMTSEQHGSGLSRHQLTPGYISSELVQNPVSPTPYVSPSKKDYEILFQQLFDEYFSPSPRDVSPDPIVVIALRAVDLVGSPSSTTIDKDVPSASTLPTNQEIQSQVIHQGVEEQIHGHQNV
ncbi:hypothetical protein Tco_1544997 [Tanacetum coccineum]